jgi:hypothetical protein
MIMDESTTRDPRPDQGISIAEGKKLAREYPLVTGPLVRWCYATRGRHPYELKCTRLHGHDGPHVAHITYDEAAASWD